jgi:Ser-tRNA(Ala) deacylase AlaX
MRESYFILFILTMEANATQQLYWNDTYAFESESKVVRVEDTGNGGFSVILDSTIFYPQGGSE